MFRITNIIFGLSVALFAPQALAAGETPAQSAGSALPDAGSALLRMGGALVFVVALFFGGVWLFRNWQRLNFRKGRAPKLNVLESKSLGGRHAVYVVGYEEQRFLIGSSPSGIQMLAHLPEGEETTEAQPAVGFMQSLQQVLAASTKRKV
jgi:flagellar biogenesis protein FliO